MSLEAFELHPNAKLNIGGSDGHVVTVDRGLVTVAREDGKVDTYTVAAVTEQGTTWVEPDPEPEPAAPDVPAPAATSDNTNKSNTEPAAVVSPPADPATPADDDARIAELESELAMARAARAGRAQTD